MLLNSTLVGRETQPQVYLITAEKVSQFAKIIGDPNPLFDNASMVWKAGYANTMVPPVFVTCFNSGQNELFMAANIDYKRLSALQWSQDYIFNRPLRISDAISVHHCIASIEHFVYPTKIDIMVIEQLYNTLGGERVATGIATFIVREVATGERKPASRSLKSTDYTAETINRAITSLKKHITEEMIIAYAKASGDYNAIHLDPKVAQAVGLNGTIAHGMLSMAFMGQLLSDWLTTIAISTDYIEHFTATFQAAIRPGDTLQCYAIFGHRTNHKRRVKLWIENQFGECVTIGTATIVEAPL